MSFINKFIDQSLVLFDNNLLKFAFRFSLLLLEPGEIYFEDFSVFHYPSELPEEEAIKRYICVCYMY